MAIGASKLGVLNKNIDLYSYEEASNGHRPEKTIFV